MAAFTQNADPGLIDRTIAQARALAARVIGGAVDTVSAFSNPLQALEHLSEAERRVGAVRAALVELDTAGLARPEDFRAYDKVRGNLWLAQLQLWSTLVKVLAFLGLREQLLQLPHPQIMPEVQPRRGTGLAGTRGLGNPAAAAAPAVAPVAAAPAVVYWAGAALVILAAAAVVAAFAGLLLAADQIASIFIVQAQAGQLQQFNESRLQAWRECLAAGRAPQECAASIAGVIPQPPPLNLGDRPLSWIFYVGAGVGLLSLVGLGVYAWKSPRVKGKT